MTVSLSTYYRITRMSALYDLLVTAPFATPWTFALVYPLLSHANAALGGAALAPPATVHVLIACLFGSLVVLWAALRLARPSLVLGRYDGAGRFVFALWMGWALAQRAHKPCLRLVRAS